MCGVMTVGIICAIPEELDDLRQRLVLRGEQFGAGLTFLEGELNGVPVVLVGGGIGKVNAAVTTALLADRFGCDPIVFSGVAGGLDPALGIGDVVIAERAVQHDAGVMEEGRLRIYQAGHVPFFNPTDRLGFAPPARLLARVRERLADFRLPPLSRRAGGGGMAPRIVFGTVLSGDQFIGCEATRERLFRELGGQAVEMEGGALAQTAERFGVGWLNIRALSDLAGRTSRFDFEAFVSEVARHAAAILLHLLPVLDAVRER